MSTSDTAFIVFELAAAALAITLAVILLVRRHRAAGGPVHLWRKQPVSAPGMLATIELLFGFCLTLRAVDELTGGSNRVLSTLALAGIVSAVILQFVRVFRTSRVTLL
ncbi:hypothetical protein GCM10010435_91560 [Winogradskya consettensis]|uniref:Uncharacterized protein n=1 Tax=Winogradskya consettensis TaxID=113560 RepID=A0A919T059_9ACTN|nr:hypothetical protein [Actinoplanes consettensis]GIM81442.1 hypothetical protein Aco04nite_76600 [Actinoplanes consettensis]